MRLAVALLVGGDLVHDAGDVLSASPPVSHEFQVSICEKKKSSGGVFYCRVRFTGVAARRIEEPESGG